MTIDLPALRTSVVRILVVLLDGIFPIKIYCHFIIRIGKGLGKFLSNALRWIERRGRGCWCVEMLSSICLSKLPLKIFCLHFLLLKTTGIDYSCEYNKKPSLLPRDIYIGFEACIHFQRTLKCTSGNASAFQYLMGIIGFVVLFIFQCARLI